MNIVVVNSGSTSLKMSMFQTVGESQQVPEQAVWNHEQAVDWQTEDRDSLEKKVNSALSLLWEGEKSQLQNREQIGLVGHRIVHGGPTYSQPIEVSYTVKQDLRQLNEFAPLHNPINMSALDLAQRLLPQARHIAVFDTAFHSTLPPQAAIYSGPYSWYSDLKIKKYGFHGISHKYCSHKAAELLGQPGLRIVSCHLGGGCSLSAIVNGKSMDTTMGFTPLDGLMMRSRCGGIDPGILIYLLKGKKYSLDQLDYVLNTESGMKGIFERSADLRDITEAMKDGDERAKLTIDMFVHRLSGGIAAMVAAIGGIDTLLFTGGIGENSAEVRSATCEKLAFLNLAIDEGLNASKPIDVDIASKNSPTRILVINTREDWQIATECAGLL